MLSQKLAYLRELPGHLRQLSGLLGRPVGREELLSVDDTEKLRASTAARPRGPGAHFRIPFSAKTSPSFQGLRERLVAANPSPVHLWLPTTAACGLLPPLALRSVDFGFPFELVPGGIVKLVTADQADEMVLDFSVERGEEVLDVTLGGEHWRELARD